MCKISKTSEDPKYFRKFLSNQESNNHLNTHIKPEDKKVTGIHIYIYIHTACEGNIGTLGEKKGKKLYKFLNPTVIENKQSNKTKQKFNHDS